MITHSAPHSCSFFAVHDAHRVIGIDELDQVLAEVVARCR
jgi:hypothetical protein